MRVILLLMVVITAVLAATREQDRGVWNIDATITEAGTQVPFETGDMLVMITESSFWYTGLEKPITIVARLDDDEMGMYALPGGHKLITVILDDGRILLSIIADEITLNWIGRKL